MNKEDELKSITILKTVMMLTVVLYHSILALVVGGWGGISFEYTGKILPSFAAWLTTIHTYAFTFASGYLFYMIRYEYGKYRTMRIDIAHRMRKLLIPYYTISFFWVVPFKLLFFGGDLKRILCFDILLGISPAQLWFLPMLFIDYLVFYFLSDFFNKINKRYAVALFLGIYYCRVVLDKILPLGVFQIGNAMEYLLFYFLGFQYRKEKSHFLEKIPAGLVVCIELLAFGSYYWLRNEQNLRILAVLLKPFVCLTGVYFAVYVCSKASAFVRENKLYRILRDNSMAVYMFHQQFIYIIMRTINRTIVPDIVYVLMCFLLSIVCALLTCALLKHFHFGRLVLG